MKRLFLINLLLIALFHCGIAQPANDRPCTAAILVATPNCNYQTFNNTGATPTTAVPQPTGASCNGWGGGRDVWFKIPVPANGALTITTNTGTITDGVMAVYRGTNCNTLVLLGCDDDSGPGLMPQYSATGLNFGDTVFVRFWRYNSNTGGTFQICATLQIPNEQDCLGALPICQNVYSTVQSYSGTGNILNEINTATSCLASGEKNDVWYTFTVQQSGNLNFTITPNDLSDDYDWAVYNLTNNNCQDIFTTPSLEVSCNYSSTPGATGTSNTATSNSQTASGTRFNRPIPVTAGQTYVVNVSNFSSSQSGYTIDFGASTAVILDNVPPRFRSIDTLPSCGSTRIPITFSENVLCNTVLPSSFVVSGPGGSYTVTGIFSVYCNLGATYDNSYTLIVSPAFTQTGNYTICFAANGGGVIDLCGNLSQANSPCLSFSVTELTLNTSKTDVTCLGGTNGSVSVNATGASGNYTYSWSGGGTSATITNVGAGTYTVTVTSGLCTKTASVTVNEPPTGITVNTSVTPANCGQNDGTATASSPGVGPFTYNWSSGHNTSTATNLSAGNYSVTVRDANNCSAVANVTVPNVNSTLSLVLRGDTACGGGTGTLFVSPSGGNGNYTYQWSNGQTTDTIKNLANGTYSVTVRDAANCSVTASTGVRRTPVISLSATSTLTSCGQATGTATVNASGGAGSFTYVWSNNQTAATATNLYAGVYSVTVTDAHNCKDSTSVTVSQTGGPTISNSTKTDVTCFNRNNGAITVTATGGSGNLQYIWSNLQIGNSAANLGPGIYTVTVSDANNCTSTATFTITQPDSLTISSFSIDSSSCHNGTNGRISILVTGGTGNFTYLWNNGQNTSTATNLSAGNYTVTVSDANNCTLVRTFTVYQPTPIQINFVTDSVICYGTNTGKITALPSGGVGGYSFAWDNGQNQHVVQNLIAGNYTVTITDSKNCTSTASASVVQPPALAVANPVITHVKCKNGNDGSITVDGSGGVPPYNFLWSNNQPGKSIQQQTAGVYSVTVADKNNCTTTQTFQIEEPASALSIDSVITDSVSCFGGTNGSATVYASGGTGNYTYVWSSNSSVNSSANGFSKGSYFVRVTDANNCSASQSFFIEEPPAVTVQIADKKNPRCHNGNDGEITAAASGGTGSYSFAWSNNLSGNPATNLTKGLYSLTLSDKNGCTAQISTTLTDPLPISVSVNTANARCFGESTGTASAFAQGGTPPYVYQWSGGNGNGSMANGFSAGSYTVTVSDFYNCTAQQTFAIGQEDSLQLFGTTTPEKCTYTSDGTISLTAFGGVSPYVFSINGNGLQQTNTEGFFDLVPDGLYTVSVRDGNNCLAVLPLQVEPAQPDEFLVETDTTTCFGDVYRDGRIVLSPIFPANGPYWYSLNGTDFRSKGIFDSLAHGHYTVLVKNANQCEINVNAYVPQPPPLEVAITPALLLIDLGEGATVSASSTARYHPTYEWSPAHGLSCTDCPAPMVTTYTDATYQLTVRDWRNKNKFCVANTGLKVQVGPHGKVMIPNLFSPNADGINDVFYVYGNNVREVSLKIFNRWGEKVFETSHIYEGWDGTYKNAPQPPDVFTYIVEFTFLDNQKLQKQGTLTLIR
jgi:gliding motility-associated-like protein